MTQDEIYLLVDKWVREIAAQTGRKGAIAIRESETGPRPTSTQSGSLCRVPETGLYVTMDIASDDIYQECGPTISPCGECFEETQCCLHELTIDLQSYRCGAYDFLSDLRASLKLNSIRSQLFPEMSVRDVGPITNISAIIKASKEERAAVSIVFGYMSIVSCPIECLTLDCDPCFDPCIDEIQTEIESCP